MDSERRTTAAIYARISEDDLGTEAGVKRQLADGRALCEARGWTVAGEYHDNDVSAANGALRSGCRQLMADAAAGRFDRIVCYHTSWLWRARTERAEAIGALAAARVSVVAVKGPDLDLASAYGRGMAGLLGEFDTMESEVKGERVARAALQRAQEGRANGPVAYGWRRIVDRDDRGQVVGWRDVVDPDQAEVVRGIVDRLLAGESLRAVRDDLNARGVPTPRGKGQWRSSTVRKLALRPANVADRVYHGEVIGPAAWPPLVDRDRHDRVVALLSNPTRTAAEAASERRHLLTYGVGECGVCGGILRHVVRRSGDRTYPLYVCDANGCVGRSDERVDALVRAVVVERLSRPDAAAAFHTSTAEAADAHERAEHLRARLDLAAEQYADGVLDGRQLARITEKLRPQLEAAQDEYRQLAGAAQATDVLEQVTAGDAAAVWDRLDVARRRALLEVLGLRVRIMRTRQGPGFEPRDVKIDWRP